MLLPVPGVPEGPGGVVVICEDFLLYKGAQGERKCKFPTRFSVNKVMINSYGFHKQKVFIYIYILLYIYLTSLLKFIGLLLLLAPNRVGWFVQIGNPTHWRRRSRINPLIFRLHSSRDFSLYHAQWVLVRCLRKRWSLIVPIQVHWRQRSQCDSHEFLRRWFQISHIHS